MRGVRGCTLLLTGLLIAVALILQGCPGWLFNQSFNEATIYWTSFSGSIHRASLDASNEEDLVTSGLDHPWDIELDNSRGKMYWSDQGTCETGVSGTGKIETSKLTGQNRKSILTDLKCPIGIAIDRKAGKLYWADELLGKIQRANLDGSKRETLVTGLSWLRDIELAPSIGKMYWGAYSPNKIQRANLDGSNVETIVNGLRDPRHIVLNPIEKQIYWTSGIANFPGKISKAKFNGHNIEHIVTQLGYPRGIELTRETGKLYWSDTGVDKVKKSNLDGSRMENLSMVSEIDTLPFSIVVLP